MTLAVELLGETAACCKGWVGFDLCSPCRLFQVSSTARKSVVSSECRRLGVLSGGRAQVVWLGLQVFP